MKIALIGVMVLGFAGVVFFGYFALQDWALLRRAFASWKCSSRAMTT